MKEIGNANKSLIPNVFVLCNLLIVNPVTSFTPERSFSTTRRLKAWLKSTMINRRFNSLCSLCLLNVHKELTGKLDLAEIGNEFIFLNMNKQFQYFGKFAESDFA